MSRIPIGQLVVNLIADTAKFVSPFNQATNAVERNALKIASAVEKIEKGLTKAGNQLTLRITAPLAAFSVAAVKAADKSGDFVDSVERLGRQAQAALEPIGRNLIAVFEQWRPAIEDGVRFINALGQAFDELDEPTKRQIIQLGALAAAIGPALLLASSGVLVTRLATQQIALASGAIGDLLTHLVRLPNQLDKVKGSLLGVLGNLKQMAVAAAGIGAVYGAFTVGRGIYDQFKLVQTGLASLMRVNDITWSHIREVGYLAWTFIADTFEKVLDRMQRGAGRLVKFWAASMIAMGQAAGGDFGRTLTETGAAISAWGAEIEKIEPPKAWFEFEKLNPLRRLASQAKDLAEALGPEAAAKINAAWAKIVLVPNVDGQGAPIAALAGISSAVDTIVANYQRATDPALKGLAEQIAMRRDELFTAIGDLPPDLQRKLIRSQEAAARQFARDTYTTTIESINKEFAGRATKGAGFWDRIGDRMLGDVEAFKRTISDIPDLVVSAAGRLSDDGLIGSVVSLLERAKTLAAGVKLPEVITKRDKERLEEAAKALERMKAVAESIKDAVDPGRALRRQAIEAIDAAGAGLIDNETLAKRLKQLQDQFRKLGEIAEDTFGEKLAKGIENFSSRASDAFTEFAFGARDAFDDVAKNFAKMLLNITVQENIFKPLATAFGGYVGRQFAGDASTTQAVPDVNGKNAIGGVFAAGRKLAFAAGGVVSRPTLFPMANGGIGLMGEAGPEAIMPLKRINGRLGVAAVGGSSPVINIFDQRGSGDPVEVKSRQGATGREIDVFIRDKMREAFADGSMDRIMNSTYGVPRRGARR